MALQPTCPLCGGTEIVEGKSIFEGSIYTKNRLGLLKPHEVLHQCCANCGTIITSTVIKKKLCSCGICKSA